MATQLVTTRPVSAATSIATRSTAAAAPTAIVGVRAEAGALVVMEAGGAEHRCATALELWACLHKIVHVTPEQVVAVDSSTKAERRKLFEAFGVLASKGRDKLADRVGEDTVSAVETIGSTVGRTAIGFLRRTAVRGSSSLGSRYSKGAASK